MIGEVDVAYSHDSDSDDYVYVIWFKVRFMTIPLMAASYIFGRTAIREHHCGHYFSVVNRPIDEDMSQPHI